MGLENQQERKKESNKYRPSALVRARPSLPTSTMHTHNHGIQLGLWPILVGNINIQTILNSIMMRIRDIALYLKGH
jgi:hypothetical protein